MQISAALVKELRERTGAGMMECKRALVDAQGDVETAIEAMRKSGQAKADRKAGRTTAEGLIAFELGEDSRVGAIVEVNCETDFVAKETEFREFANAVAKCVLKRRPTDSATLLGLPLDGAGSDTVDVRRRALIAKIGENISLRRFAVLESREGRVGVYSHGGRIGVLVAVEGGDEAVAKDIAMHVAASRPVCVSPADVHSDVLEKEERILIAQAAESGKPPEIRDKMVAGRLKKFLSEITLLGQPFVKDLEISMESYLKQVGATVLEFQRFEVGEGIEKKEENFAEEVMAQVRDH